MSDEYDNGYSMIPDLTPGPLPPGPGPVTELVQGIGAALILPLCIVSVVPVGIMWQLISHGVEYRIAILLTIVVIAAPIILYRRLARPTVR